MGNNYKVSLVPLYIPGMGDSGREEASCIVATFKEESFPTK